MPFPSKNTVRTWVFITVISIAIHVLGQPAGEKKFDLKIGFDLTQGANGSPSLRIRDFEDSKEFSQRANNQENVQETKPTARAASSSDIDEFGGDVQQAKRDMTKESKSNEDDESSSSGEDQRLSTRGIKAADYEPEEHIKRNGKVPSSDDESERKEE